MPDVNALESDSKAWAAHMDKLVQGTRHRAAARQQPLLSKSRGKWGVSCISCCLRLVLLKPLLLCRPQSCCPCVLVQLPQMHAFNKPADYQAYHMPC